jgi:alkanesulfonate monooxygenase SsuD/methylene tetrahydromethanopterin reductase-like flavin-dependent oxidoreductase (luciferase family)
MIRAVADSPASPGLRFGISVTPYAATYAEIVAQVRAAETLQLDLVGIQDHPYQRRYLDTFALIADLLARTTRLRFFPDVASLPLRGPAMLAKVAASLDVMSGGRFELGLGAGTFWDAVAGMGGPRRSNREAAEALEEAIPVIRAALGGERVVRSPGPHYPIPGYPPGPPPLHRVEIWVGAYRPRGLRTIGRLADGWVPSVGRMTEDALRAGSATIDDAAVAAGRDPRLIRRILNIGGRLTDGATGDGPLDGPPQLWIERLLGWVDEVRADSFVFWPSSTDVAEIERFAAEVVPGVRGGRRGTAT